MTRQESVVRYERLRDGHPQAAKAFEKDELGRTAAREMTFVKPARQAEMLKELRGALDE